MKTRTNEVPKAPGLTTAFALVLMVLAAGLPAFGQTTITIAPTTAQVRLGGTYQFSDKVTGNTNTNVAWTVALPAGDTGSPGTVSAGGRYTPPAALPSGNTVIVTVASIAAPTVSASATISLQNPYPALSSTIPASVAVGAFTLTMNGNNFVNGAQVIFGGVPLPTVYVSATRLTATGTAAQSQNNQRIAVTVSNPAPGPATSIDVVTVTVGTLDGTPKITANVAGRFLDQAAFGPDAATVAHVQSVGLNGYITEQFTAPITPYPDPNVTASGIGPVQARFFSNAVHGPDQLRQRVALALSEIMVASGVEESSPSQLVPYLQVFQQDAFGNFRTLMNDVTLNVAMGEYLDMRNNDKANPAADTLANENYARELMQLFTIGLSQMNQDGTLQLDSSGNPIPTYDQTTVQNFAKVYTGWTYPTKPGATPAKHNPAYYGGPMVAFEANHDTTAKTLLQYAAPAGVFTSLPAGQSAETDLAQALDNIFNHPNVAPFIGKQLIQHLVTSNPSQAYVGRVAAVFNNNGSGVRGDLTAVVRAILLDHEARDGDSAPAFNVPVSNFTGISFSPGFHAAPAGTIPTTEAVRSQTLALVSKGHLREPMVVIPSILRGLGAQVNDTNNLNSLSTGLGQNVFSPPSVFSYFAPGYQIPADFTSGDALGGPEFQLQSPSAAVGRVNMLNTMIYGSLGTGAVIDLTALSALGNDPAALMLAINNAFFHGQMPANMQSEVLAGVNAVTGTTAAAQKARVQAALYLALSSSFYNVQH